MRSIGIFSTLVAIGFCGILCTEPRAFAATFEAVPALVFRLYLGFTVIATARATPCAVAVTVANLGAATNHAAAVNDAVVAFAGTTILAGTAKAV